MLSPKPQESYTESSPPLFGHTVTLEEEGWRPSGWGPPLSKGHSEMGPYLVVQVGKGLLLAIQEDLAGRLLHAKDAQCANGDLGGLGAGMEDGGGEDVL